MPSLPRTVLAYIAIVLLAALWASFTELAPAYAGREHLQPAVLLYFVTLPSSVSVQALFERWPSVFGTAAVQIGAFVASGALQAALLYLILGLRQAKVEA